MKQFGGPALLLDRSDINTDEIIPAKYLTESSKTALQPHLLEDLLLHGKPFNLNDPAVQQARVVATRANFGCGSSREHAVWAFEVNDIKVVIAQSFARIFRQNMFNCGILAVELTENDIDRLFNMKGSLKIEVDMEGSKLVAISDSSDESNEEFTFQLNDFDRSLVEAGGWLSYADAKY
ncbi:MAG: 3-isopropylmalate dehydratase small subunit [Thermodesulfobacteriota bacterium]